MTAPRPRRGAGGHHRGEPHTLDGLVGRWSSRLGARASATGRHPRGPARSVTGRPEPGRMPACDGSATRRSAIVISRRHPVLGAQTGPARESEVAGCGAAAEPGGGRGARRRIGVVPFPQHRLRRLRRTPAMRRLVAETRLGVDDLVAPLFVREGIDRPAHRVAARRRAAHPRLAAGEVGELAALGVPRSSSSACPSTRTPTGSGAMGPRRHRPAGHRGPACRGR